MTLFPRRFAVIGLAAVAALAMAACTEAAPS